MKMPVKSDKHVIGLDPKHIVVESSPQQRWQSPKNVHGDHTAAQRTHSSITARDEELLDDRVHRPGRMNPLVSSTFALLRAWMFAACVHACPTTRETWVLHRSDTPHAYSACEGNASCQRVEVFYTAG